MAVDYDSRRNNMADAADVKDHIEHLNALMGDNPSTLVMTDYVRRALDAGRVVARWRDMWTQWSAHATGYKELTGRHLPWLSDSEALDYLPSMQDDEERLEKINEHYAARLRIVLDDPEGEYLLVWHDFCRTGVTQLIVHEQSFTVAAKVLANRIEDSLVSSSQPA